MTTDYVVTNNLSSRLKACSQGQLQNGRLDVINPAGQRWSLYFHLGHLIGEAGGIHPLRRWRRQLSQYCAPNNKDALRYWDDDVRDYDSLAKLVRQQEISRQQMVAIVQDNLAEVLFDILQQEELLRYTPPVQLTYNFVAKDTLYPSPLVFIPANQAWKQAQQAWIAWRQAGLVDYSPNMVPAIRQHEKLRQQIPASAYRSLTDWLDGKQTIRDLALKLKQAPLLLTQSLVPYIQKGLMQLVEVGDLSDAAVEHSQSKRPGTVVPQAKPARSQSRHLLVAYIDDSPIDSQIMGEIVTRAGYGYVNLQDSVQALPMLLEHKPDLIFLDLVMPIANGYEICAQIRRASIFKDTPVIIVTGNDGIVDRVRAKLVRSTDFLAKPISPEKVLAVLRRYLALPNSIRAKSEHRRLAEG